MFGVVLLNMAFLYLIGGDALEERNTFQFFADSNTYLKVSRGEYFGVDADSSLINVSSNYLGPVLILRLLANNIYLVMLLNCLIFFLSVVHISKALSLNPLKVSLIMFMSPLTVSSLLSINKEIFIFAFMAFALSGYIRRSFSCVVVATGISVLSRWHLTVFYFLFLAVTHSFSLFSTRKQVVLVLLATISIGYMMSAELIQPILDVVERSIADYEGGGSGLYEGLLGLQAKGLYFLVFPLKAAQLLFGLGVRMDKLFFPDNVYNDVFIVLHSAAVLIVFIVMFRKKILTLQSDLFFISVLYLLVFCLTPIFAPRYLYFVYILWVLIISGAPSAVPRLSKAQCRGWAYKFIRRVAEKRPVSFMPKRDAA